MKEQTDTVDRKCGRRRNQPEHFRQNDVSVHERVLLDGSQRRIHSLSRLQRYPRSQPTSIPIGFGPCLVGIRLPRRAIADFRGAGKGESRTRVQPCLLHLEPLPHARRGLLFQ